MYPLLLTPAVKDYLWGGQKLKTEFGYTSDSNKLAEAWVLSCHHDGACLVQNGKHAGRTLAETLSHWGAAALGTRAAAFSDFPLLIKLIDAQDRLSVQVHPDDAYALANEGEFGKTEMWYVVDCNDGARLIYGLNREVSREELAQHIHNNTLEQLCRFVPVHPGDVFFIEAGTLHAIGAGILIAEVQQNSNTTYRVSDYGRLGADGKPRPLHIEKALDVTRRSPSARPCGAVGDIEKTEFGWVRQLASCDLFVSDLMNINGTAALHDPGSFLSLVVLTGWATVNHGNNTFAVGKGASVFVPADCPVTVSGRAQLLVSRV